MNRDILFRGKRLDNGELVTGRLITDDSDGKKFIVSWIGDHCEEDIDSPNRYIECFGFGVDPETVGQYTGLNDKNGVRIFEGDICKYRYGASTYIGKVVFNTRACIFEMRRTEIVGYHGERGIKTQLLNHIDKVEVIGNVHDNPELLEVPGND